MKMNELNYETPEVEVVEVAVEQGFAATINDQITITPIGEEDVKEELFN